MAQNLTKKPHTILESLMFSAIPIGGVYIVLIIVIAAAVIQVRGAQDNINVALLPLIGAAKNAAVDVNYITANLPHFHTTPTLEELQAWQAGMIPRLADLSTHIKFIANSDYVDVSTNELIQLEHISDAIVLSITDLGETLKQKILLEKKLSDQFLEVKDLLASSVVVIESHVAGFSTDADTVMAYRRARELQFNLERLLNYVHALEDIDKTEGINNINSLLSVLFAETAKLNSRVRIKSLREALGESLQRVFLLMLDGGGIIAHKKMVANKTEASTELIKKTISAATAVQEIGDQIIARAEQNADTASHHLSSTIKTILLVLVLSFISIVLVTIFFFAFGVINNVVLPIKGITETTLKIASGNLNTHIQPQRISEFIKLNEALEVFRTHSMDLVQKEIILKERNLTLRQANEDLEHFAYIASHDLKSPLRGISNLANFLAEDLPPEAKDVANPLLEKMYARIRRMEALLNDLLEYSRLGAEHVEMEVFATELMLKECFELVSSADRRIHLLVGAVPEQLNTYRTPLMQVVRNLFDNAIKHHDRAEGTLEVRCKEEEDFYVFSVKDDGPGIAEEYQQRIFKVFHRLKSRDQVEGSGVGLSMVKKILQRFGGTIAVHSSPSKERGTEFVVRWPKAALPRANEEPDFA